MANSPRRILSPTYISPTVTSAIGIWTLKEQLQANNTNTWPGAPTDSLNSVEYLIAGGGGSGGGGTSTNGRGGGGGAGGLVYGTLDTSTNKQITVVIGSGGAGVASARGISGTATSISNNSSNNTVAVFSGSNNLSFAKSGTNWDLGTGDFTIECWVNPSNFTALQYIAAQGNITTTACWALAINTSGQFVYYLSSAATTFNIAAGIVGGTLTANVWHHIALVRNGSTFTPYVNGIPGISTINAATIFTSSDSLYLGTTGALANRFTGYLTNFRIVKGVGVYTGPFSTPNNYLTLTQNANSNGNPSVAIIAGQTVMLTLQSNPAVDLAYATVLTNTAAVTYTTTTVALPVQSAVALGGGGGGAYLSAQTAGASGGGGATDTGFGVGASTQFSRYGYGFGNQGGVGMTYVNTNVSGAGGGGGAGVAGTNPSVTTTNATTLGSIYFNGSSNYLTVPTGSDSSFEANVNFTVEAWIYLNSYAPASITGAALIGTSGASTATGWYINVGQDVNTLRLTSNASGTWTDNISVGSGNGIPLNTWTHIALCRSGSNIRLFKNGQVVASSASANTWSFTTPQGVTYIGGPTVGTYTRYLNAYVTDLRIVKGTALYSTATAFTPTTIPLTAVSDTKLLLNAASSTNYLTDSSTNNYVVTNADNTSYVLFTPYTNTATTTIVPGTGGTNMIGIGNAGNAIGAAGQGGLGNTTYASWLQAVSKGQIMVKGGSILFSGASNTYLILRHGTLLNIPVAAASGTDFTIECWVYLTGKTGSPCVFANHAGGGAGSIALFAGHTGIGGGPTKWTIYTPSNGTWTTPGALGYDGSGNGSGDGRGRDIVYNTWIHLAIVRQGSGTNNAKFYIDGAFEAQMTWSVGLTAASTNWFISASGDGTSGTNITGVVSNFRVTGSAVYTGPFTPPTSVLETVQNAGTNITAINNVSTTYSVQFSGTNQYIYATNSQFNLTNDFTVEGWFYPTSFATAMNLFDTLAIGGAAARTAAFAIRTVVTTGVVGIFTNSALSTTTTTGLSLNAWNHVAVVRTSTTIKIYINGISLATITNSTVFIGNGLTIGTNSDAVTGAAGFVGYISNVRVVNGLGVYVSNFTVPTTTLTATQASLGQGIRSITTGQTVFLGLQSPTHIDNTGTALGLTAVNLSLPTIAQTPFKSVVKFLMNTSDTIDYSYNAIPISIGQGGATRSASSPFASTTDTYYICGGGSGAGGVYQAFGGAGGGGAGAGSSETGAAGLANTGGGGGGGGGQSGTTASSGSGGSGLAIIRYPSSFANATTTTGSPTGPIVVGNYKYYTFTGTGTLGFYTSIILDYLVVGGGGGGGGTQGGGGGAGGLVANSLLSGPNEYSASFNGTTQYLTIPGNTAFAFGTNNFTIESWFYPTTATGTIVDTRSGAGGTTGILYYASSLMRWFVAGDVITATAAMSLNTWHHVALVRNAGITKLYLDGTQVGSSYTDTNNYILTNTIYIGRGNDAGNILTGNISNLRIVKGVAVYTQQFTPPNGALTSTQAANINGSPSAAITGTQTSLLTLQNATFVDNSTNNFSITAVAGPSLVSTSHPFNVTNSNRIGATWTGPTGFITGSSLSISLTTSNTYTVTVGAGGSAGAIYANLGASGPGGPGGNSVLGSITAYGGGGGGTTGYQTASVAIGNAGGSGGGGGNDSTTTTGGSGTSGQGNNGGAGLTTAQTGFNSGGGGGAATAGLSATITSGTNLGGAGGVGISSSITGTAVTYAGGGGGTGNNNPGAGGAGGGGAGSSATATAGTANTGGGGGGSRDAAGGAGGSGVVIIAYPDIYPNLATVTGTLVCNGSANNIVPDTVSRSGYKIYKFTAGTGTISW